MQKVDDRTLQQARSRTKEQKDANVERCWIVLNQTQD